MVRVMSDLRYLSWNDSESFGSSFGMLNKAEELTSDGHHYYYKLSRMQGSAIVGFESVFEYIASRYFDVLGIPHVVYDILPANIHIRDKDIFALVCRSEDYKLPEDEAVPIEEFCPERDLAESTIIKTFGAQVLFQIYLVDFLINNVDRHGHNLEVVLSNGRETIAPLFDHGSCLLHWAPNEDSVQRYDVLTDTHTNNYVGDESLFTNLHKITNPVLVNPLTPRARSYIFYNLKNQYLPQGIKDKTWEMICVRYNYAKNNNFLIERSTPPAEASSHFNSC